MGYLLVRRKGFYIHRKGKRIYIPPTTFRIRDRGKKGRGKKLIPIRKGKLAPYTTAMVAASRRRVLSRLVKRYGATSVYRALMAQVIFRKRMRDHAKSKFLADARWLKQRYGIGRR